ncbi:uncharacterized protein LOC135129809 isoform X3 [Zophobas morio]|uniref:uncharacterized protein LOC135129809 isoform X3 n=1 Tax=Zophobas morio TaxID=2755281 RepID=UPI0030830C47
MDQQQRGDDSKNKKVVVQDSIKKLKEKLVPGIKYGLLISAIINLSMLVVGCLNVHKCPVNKHIPLFLIATGAIGLMSKFVSYVRDRISAHVQGLTGSIRNFNQVMIPARGIYFATRAPIYLHLPILRFSTRL